MEVMGNGQCVKIQSRYDLPYTKVWVDGKQKEYWIQIPYEKVFIIWDVIRKVIADHGRDKKFWNILGNVLDEQFNILDFDTPKKDKKFNVIDKIIETVQITNDNNITVSYAKIIYTGEKVEINLYNGENPSIVTFKRRKTWSHKKYVDKALEKSGLNPSYDFRYGWEICS